MVEKKITKAAATRAAKKEAAAKAAATTTATATKTAVKKAPAKRATAAKTIVYVSALNAGFKAGDVYQALAAAEKALTVAEIAKKAKCTAEEVYLGIGWLLKEGKIASTEDNKVVLA